MDERIFEPAYYTVPVYLEGTCIAMFYGTYEVLDALVDIYRSSYTSDNDDRTFAIFQELTRFVAAIDDEDDM